MTKYTLVCAVDDPAQISLKTVSSRSSDQFISCQDGVLQLVEYSPSVASLTFTEIDAVLGSILMMIFIAWTLGFLVSYISNIKV